MSEKFIGQIYMGGFNFAPRNSAFCNGQILSIAQNTALFSLLGTTYGGNGQTTFALPDLRGRTPVGFASSADGSWQPPPLSQGQVGGVESVTLLTSNVPPHGHQLAALSTAGNTRNPNGAVYAATSGTPLFGAASGANVSLHPNTVSVAGATQPHTNVQPSVVINFCIVLFGIFPSRN